MRALIFTHEFPYPANNGGRVDIFNRIKALKLLGHPVFLVAWSIYVDNQSEESLSRLREMVDELVVYKRDNSLVSRIGNIAFKIAMLPFQPNIVTDCYLTAVDKENLLNRIASFKPDFVMSDAIFAGKTALYFARKLQVPFFIRSHNVEHLYVKKQLSEVSNVKGFFKLFGSYASLKKFERGILSKANAILDISINDADFWKNQGFKNIYWAPPVFFKKEHDQYKAKYAPLYDVTYVGNLYNPNNIDAIKWFLTNVLPLILIKVPNIKINIAGSKPTDELIAKLKKYEVVTMTENPSNILDCYVDSKVMINPTQFGSGVNLKTIEQLFQDNPVVCTSVALVGLPTDFNTIYYVSDNPQQFAKSIVNILADFDKTKVGTGSESTKEALRNLFSPEYYCEIIKSALININ